MNTTAALKQTLHSGTTPTPALMRTLLTDANSDLNSTHGEDIVSAKPDAATGDRASAAPVPNVCTEDDPDPIQQPKENPQALTNSAKAQDTTAKLTTESKETMNAAKTKKPKLGNVVMMHEREGAKCSTGTTGGWRN